jgi:hypothetical protein
MSHREQTMQRLGTIFAVLVISGGVAVAQSSGGAGGGTGGTASGSSGANTASPSGAGSVTPGAQLNGPNNPVPGASTPSPADQATVGRAPGVNPANPQDASRRGNPSDRTLPAARNPQDLKMDSTGTPVIIAPERR